jgi:hypothetical protein
MRLSAFWSRLWPGYVALLVTRSACTMLYTVVYQHIEEVSASIKEYFILGASNRVHGGEAVSAALVFHKMMRNRDAADQKFKTDQPQKRLFPFIFTCFMYVGGCDGEGEGFPDFDAISILWESVGILSSLLWTCAGACSEILERSDRGSSKSTNEDILGRRSIGLED